MSAHRLRLRASCFGSEGAEAALHFFWSGLFTGVNDDGGGNFTSLATPSVFTTVPAEVGVFFRGATVGTGADALAGVGTGLAPHWPKDSKRHLFQTICLNPFYNTNPI